MAGDKTPSLQSLEKPEKLHDILRQDRGDDCLSCKIIGMSSAKHPEPRTQLIGDPGSGVFFGLAGYSYFSGMSQLKKQEAVILQSKSMFGMRSRKFGIVTISASLLWMGLWRAFR